MNPRKREGDVYDLVAQDLSPKVDDGDRLISEAIYKNKGYLGPRGMIEYALVIARELDRTEAPERASKLSEGT